MNATTQLMTDCHAREHALRNELGATCIDDLWELEGEAGAGWLAELGMKQAERGRLVRALRRDRAAALASH